MNGDNDVPVRKRTTPTEVSTDPSKIQIVRLEAPCGWCMTGDHKNCKKELVYPPKNWICGCKTCKMDEYVPEIGVEVSKKPATEESDGT